ncbi:GrdX family protein [Clostridium tepidum]|uniref:GrdX protein n=1 Tax=Clostridium tepidum TaxID=1962263 RepID=A0A1S9I1B0_9CLOT|nr:GrdX family protein [Clostridium tepidum]MCR1933373.1 GrdX family protein [Clostridium tepidum]MDU6878230.1 GrdX family protein [Clostridium botulinum]OOO61475.1 GrdX protein [Clostridium tepidum]OOO64048.1 GrdX protein [Clostridium tepidum]
MNNKVIMITNNNLISEKFNEKYRIEFISSTVNEVFKTVRDYIHKGHELLTHPLMSSVKPNETPYRTVVISEKCKEMVDIQSLNYIEESIQSLEKFQKSCGTPTWNENILEDFRLIDYDLIYNALH